MVNFDYAWTSPASYDDPIGLVVGRPAPSYPGNFLAGPVLMVRSVGVLDWGHAALLDPEEPAPPGALLRLRGCLGSTGLLLGGACGGFSRP
jgi:hypothetical protein